MHEASCYEENCFITLTYDDKHMPPNGSLDRAAFPLFIKKLRKRLNYSPQLRRQLKKNESDYRTVRYYHCGEYGDKYGRPHYHSCLFGFDFGDKTPWSTRNGIPVFRSKILEELWPYGQSEVGSVTFESAAYVARYIEKKVLGNTPEADDLRIHRYGIENGEFLKEPEYATMSRRPGIGKPWLDRYGSDVYPSDSVVVRGKLMKPPKFYDNCFELTEPEMIDRVKALRKRSRNPEEETWERLNAREACAEARQALGSSARVL